MDAFELLETALFPADLCFSFRSAVFDGCFYYFTMPHEHVIYKFTRGFSPAGYIKIQRQYSCICRDGAEQCFWASADDHSAFIYKLDREFQEISRLPVASPLALQGGSFTQITGISYDCESDTLLVSFTECIVRICKRSAVSHIIMGSCAQSCAGVLSLPPYYAAIQQDRQEIRFFTEKGCVPQRIKVPHEYRILDILLNPRQKHVNNVPALMVIAAKHDGRLQILLYHLEAHMKLHHCNFSACMQQNDTEAALY